MRIDTVIALRRVAGLRVNTNSAAKKPKTQEKMVPRPATSTLFQSNRIKQQGYKRFATRFHSFIIANRLMTQKLPARMLVGEGKVSHYSPAA